MELKEKSKGRAGREFPVSFVVDQQLEACVLAIKQNSRPSVAQAEVVENDTSDRLSFSAVLFDNGVAVTHVRGTLRRWQGTSTKIEGDVHHLGSDETVSFGCLVVGVLALIFGIVAPIANASADQVDVFTSTLNSALSFILLIVVFFVGRTYYTRYRLTERLRELFMAR